MYKLVKWAFELGVKYERRRIKLLIADYRKDAKPQKVDDADTRFVKDEFERRQNVYYEVENTLANLIQPTYSREVGSTLLEENRE